MCQAVTRWGVLPGPSSSCTLSPIYDFFGMTVTSTIIGFHPNHDMVSHQIDKPSTYGGHFITRGAGPYRVAPDFRRTSGDPL